MKNFKFVLVVCLLFAENLMAAGQLGPFEYTYTQDAGPHLVDHRGQRPGPQQCFPRVGCIDSTIGGSFYYLVTRDPQIARELDAIHGGSSISVTYESVTELAPFYTYDHTYKVVVTGIRQ